MAFLKQIIRLTVLAVALLIGFSLSAPTAWANYIVTLSQVGSNVVATGSGTINLTDLTFFGTGTTDGGILPSEGDIVTGPTSASSEYAYTGFTGPADFGSGGGTLASSGSGDAVGLAALSPTDLLVVPQGYVSGNPLSDTSTYDNQTLASLGVTPGTYTWTWGSGANADSFTLTVAPEPSTLLLLALPLGLLALFSARSRRSCEEVTPAHRRDMP